VYELKKINVIHKSKYNQLDIEKIELDSVVVFDVYIQKNNQYAIIIKVGTLITDKLYALIQKQSKIFISSADEKNQTFTCKNLRYFIKHNKISSKNSLKLIYDINTKMFLHYLKSKTHIINIKCVENIVDSIIFLINNNANYLKNTLEYFPPEYTLANHSLHVAIYSITLGSILNFDDEKLKQLGSAGLLHDVGLKKIDEEIRNKNNKLTLAELDTVHQHSLFSVDIIKYNLVSDPDIIDAVMHHHENYDGSGYPDGLDATKISDLASILSISDVFDALTNDRPYRDKLSTFDALNLMLKDSEMINKFNRNYIKLFLRSLI